MFLRRVFVFALAIATAASALAGWRVPRFTTKSNSFARWSVTVGDHTSMFTLIRRDVEGHKVVRVREEKSDGSIVVTDYTLRDDTSLSDDPIDFMFSAASARRGDSDTNLAAISDEQLADDLKEAHDYGSVVKYAGRSEPELNHESSERYTYELDRGDGIVESGQFIINYSVPFGLVSHTATLRDRQGKEVVRFERKLVDSGELEPPPTELVAAPHPQKKTYTLREALDAGVIHLKVEIDSLSRNGERGRIVVINVSDGAFNVTVPDSPQTIEFTEGDPFRFTADAARTVRVKPGDWSQPIGIRQRGSTRVVDGTFEIMNDEGKIRFDGMMSTATIDEK